MAEGYRPPTNVSKDELDRVLEAEMVSEAVGDGRVAEVVAMIPDDPRALDGPRDQDEED